MSPLPGIKTSQFSPEKPPSPHVGTKVPISTTGRFQQPSFHPYSIQYGESKIPSSSQAPTALGKLSYASILNGTAARVNGISASPVLSNFTADSKTTVDNNTDLSEKISCTKPSSSKASTNEKGSFWNYSRVDNDESLHEFLAEINKVEKFMADIFFDAEGGNGHGRPPCNLNTIQVKIDSLRRSWLIDIKALGDKAFDTPCATGLKLSFRQILESPEIPVVWFDVRADSDSLFGHHKVHLKGVIDLQIMEMITRPGPRDWRNGLDRCVGGLPPNRLPFELYLEWNKIRTAGKRICSGPEQYAAFDRRPLPLELEEYAINDVELMPTLFCYYCEERGLCKNEELMKMVLELSERAVTETIQPNYTGNSSSHRRGIQDIIDLWNGHESDDYDYI